MRQADIVVSFVKCFVHLVDLPFQFKDFIRVLGVATLFLLAILPAAVRVFLKAKLMRFGYARFDLYHQGLKFRPQLLVLRNHSICIWRHGTGSSRSDRDRDALSWHQKCNFRLLLN